MTRSYLSLFQLVIMSRTAQHAQQRQSKHQIAGNRTHTLNTTNAKWRPARIPPGAPTPETMKARKNTRVRWPFSARCWFQDASDLMRHCARPAHSRIGRVKRDPRILAHVTHCDATAATVYAQCVHRDERRERPPSKPIVL